MKYLRDIDRWFNQNILPHERSMLNLARRMLGSREGAKDQVQDALVEIIADDKWQEIVNPRVYVMRKVYLRCIDTIRHMRVVPIRPVKSFQDMYQADLTPDQLEAVCAKEDLQRVIDALERLSPQCRKVFLMRRVENMRTSTIAKRLRISEVMVRKHVAKGHAILAQYREAIDEVDVDHVDSNPVEAYRK